VDTSGQGWERLVRAGWLFAAGSAIHTADHLRRGQGSVTEELYRLGNVALVLQVVVIMLVVTRHRLAPVAAVAIGLPLGIGFMAAHWLPHWSALSDPVWQIPTVRSLSYVASAFEILGAFAVALAGLAVLAPERRNVPRVH
jgi:hypothetical protein